MNIGIQPPAELVERLGADHPSLRAPLDPDDPRIMLAKLAAPGTPGVQKKIPQFKLVNGISAHIFQSKDGFQALCDLDWRADDILALSYAKCGTTFLQKILFLLSRLNADGELPEGFDPRKDVAAGGQLYLEWMAHQRGKFPCFANQISDLLEQPAPRIFSTHIRPELLPETLQTADSKVVVVLRNPKDAYVSYHHFLGGKGIFRGGWIGNEEFEGSFQSCMPEDEVPEYYQYTKAIQTLVDQMGDRCLVLYYEEMVTDIEANVTKLASFLDIPLTEAKKSAVLAKCSFNAMKAAAEVHPDPEKKELVRKGVNGDWKNHVDTVDAKGLPTPSAEQFKRFDEELEKLADLPIVQPLLKWTKTEAAP